MDLVFQGEVKGDVFYFLLDENLGARGVLLLLQVLDHVGEPHCQTIVAGGGGARDREGESAAVTEKTNLQQQTKREKMIYLSKRHMSSVTVCMNIPGTVIYCLLSVHYGFL